MTSTGTVQLPPDQSLTITTSNNRFILHCVSETGVELGKSPYDDFSIYTSGAYVFAETLGLVADVKSTSGLTVSASIIASPIPVKFSTEGVSAPVQSSTLTAATSGDPGAPLNFYLQSGTDENALNISFDASGGNGGNTIVSGDQAGSGGNGGSIVRAFTSNYGELFKLIAAFLIRSDIVSADTSMVVTNGSSIYVAAYQISIYPTTTLSAAIDSLMQNVRNLLSGIASGTSTTLLSLLLAIKAVRNDLVTSSDNQLANSWIGSSYFAGGFPGAGQGVTAVAGAFGKSGSDSSIFLPEHDSLYQPLDNITPVKNMGFAFAHPDQCQMLLDRANVYYYMGSATLRNQAIQILNRLLSRLSFLPLAATDPLYIAYSNNPIMPTDWSSKLQSIKTKANTQLLNIASGVDFYGNVANFVPRQSYSTWSTILDSAMADYKDFETAYIGYYDALSKQTAIQDSVSQSLNQISSLISNIDKDIDDLVSQLQAADEQITLLTQPVLDTQAALIAEYNVVIDKVKNSFNLSVPQLVNVLSYTMFSPTAGMTGLQLGNLIYQGSDQVPDNSNTPVNKNYIISTLKSSEADVEGFTTNLTMDQLDGTFTLDDPDATHLLTIEDDLEKFLSNYSATCFADVIDDLESKFNDFVKAVLARNNQILTYNACVNLLASKETDMATYQTQYTDLQGKAISATDPDLASITSYMGNIYQSARSRVMKYLTLYVRSLNFRVVEDNDVFDIAFAGVGNVDDVPLNITSTVLQSARSLVENELNNADEKWGSAPVMFPSSWTDSTVKGKRINLANADWQALIATSNTAHEITVDFTNLYSQTTPPTDFSGLCNVRVYRARFGFTGLGLQPLSSTGTVRVILTHNGTETILDQTNEPHTYTHDAISTSYSFTLNSDGTIQEIDDGNIAEMGADGQDASYAPPGPFAKWTISLANTEFNHIDFTKVKGAYFDFYGTDYALKQ